MRRDFNEHHITQVPMTENKLGEMQMMEEVAEHVGMNYADTPDSIYETLCSIFNHQKIYAFFACMLIKNVRKTMN